MKRFLLVALTVMLPFLWLGCPADSSDPVADAKDGILGGAQATVTPATAVTISDFPVGSPDHTGTLPTNKADALEIVGSGLVDHMFSAIGGYMDYVGAYMDAYGSNPSGVTRLELSGDGESSGTINASISGATFSGEDSPVTDSYGDTYEYYGDTGQLDISLLSAILSFSQVGDTAMKATADLGAVTSCTEMRYDVDGAFEWDSELGELVYQPVYSDYTINTGKLNANLKGSILMDTSSGSAGSVTYNAAISMSSGAVISPVATGLGGKFILTLNFESKATVNFTDDGSGVAVTGDALNLLLTVKVYNNSNSFVDTYTYTINDLSAYGDTSDLPLSIQKSVKKLVPSMMKKK